MVSLLMAQTEALLFGLLADDWKNLASFFVTPAIGLSVAFLLGADLLKIPFVSTDVPYKIPGRILAALACALCLVAAYTVASWLTLRLYPGPRPDVEGFKASFFHRERDEEASWLRRIAAEPVTEAYLVLDDFYNRSDLRIFVNNSRVFASYRECAWQFECKKDDQSQLREKVSALVDPLIDHNLYPTDTLNRLPLPIDLYPYLRAGVNFIDVFSNNSGLGACHVKGRIVFSMLSGKDEAFEFEIKNVVADEDSFRTIRQSGSFRTCDQFRLPASITMGTRP
ncbi:hypothetical protein [Bradyrhizobium sp. SSUT77]|uniref:hypothetical protein n=1 Tax=Bradyrhizobium sp. SSUT77 TaxID=3040603 RepID=UPI00244AA45D|nr:hypothetical protein [Bradyrhizobium sp. SSUT77]MDH2346846.1 hypothetical protein [Bradyrhizobium sp. SSUT77]